MKVLEAGPIRMAGHQHALPRRERGVEIGTHRSRRAVAAARSRAPARRCVGSSSSASICLSSAAIGSSNSSVSAGILLQGWPDVDPATHERTRKRGGEARLLDLAGGATPPIAATPRPVRRSARLRRSATTTGGRESATRCRLSTRRRRASAGSSISNETRRSPRWRENTSPSASKTPRSAGSFTRIATSRASRSRTASIGDHFRGQHARRLVVALELAAHEHQRARSRSGSRRAGRSRERR